jgi:hypothetical protein
MIESTLNPESLASGILCSERNAAGAERAIAYFPTDAEASAFQQGVAFGRAHPVMGEGERPRLV